MEKFLAKITIACGEFLKILISKVVKIYRDPRTSIKIVDQLSTCNKAEWKDLNADFTARLPSRKRKCSISTDDLRVLSDAPSSSNNEPHHLPVNETFFKEQGKSK